VQLRHEHVQLIKMLRQRCSLTLGLGHLVARLREELCAQFLQLLLDCTLPLHRTVQFLLQLSATQ
jgi:hypothetical protein